jgi:23S rRNA (cytosine1962-C5)-methyltransferase
MKRLQLKPGREKSLMRRHPWVFSGAVERTSGGVQAGDTVEVIGACGQFLAYAAFSPDSQIRARVWSFDPAASIDEHFMRAAVRRSIQRRGAPTDGGAQGVRLIHAENDGLPGVVADRYGDTAVLQLNSAGAERWREAYADALLAGGDCRRVYERSDADVRALEGLAPRTGTLRGDDPPERILVREGSGRFLVDVRQGQKSGFFLDQRDNREHVRALARAREVLDVFCYTGGFTIAALSGGARRVSAVDSSRDALDGLHANLAASGLDAERVETIAGDAFATLRRLRDQARLFDLVVLDPPKFAPTERHVARAARAYKDINLWALRLLRRGGLLVTFSCSGGIDAALFQSIVAGAALDAGADGRIIRALTAAADHPVALGFPEGGYLKGLVVQVD